MAGKASLIFVIGFGVIMGYVILNLTSLGTRATENMSWYNSATASKNLATIGMNAGLARLHADTSLSGTIASQSFNEGPYTGGSYSVNATHIGFNRLRVESASHYPLSFFTDLRDTIEVILRMLTVDDFRMYGWLTNFPGNDQFFFSGDTVWGPLHANGQFHTHPSHSPVFHGHVSVRGINPNPNSPSNNSKFLGGYTTGASDVDIPTHFNELIAAANDGGVTFDNDVWIRLHDNEVRVWHTQPVPVDNILPSPDETYLLSDFNGTMYIDGNAYLQGTLEGQLSIGARNNVNITGDITYKTDPAYITHNIGIVDGIMRQEHEGVGYDLLGVVSGNDIIINHAAPNNLTNLELHGIFFALGSFDVTSLPNIGTLDTWGSMIQRSGRATLRSPSGDGYRQRYRYDTRLEDGTLRPPAFPGFHRPTGFEIVGWYESIQLPKF
jgi:hypothetical protein